MSTVYFDPNTKEFYTEPKEIQIVDFSPIGQIARTRIEELIHHTDPLHIGPFCDVISFNLTKENQRVTKISVVPMEIIQDENDNSLFHIKYCCVYLSPKCIINGKRLYRSYVYNLSQVTKLQSFIQQDDNISAVNIQTQEQTVTDITYCDTYISIDVEITFDIRKL